jgi:hypothetical protein
MTNKNQNSRDNRNDSEQPDGWFDPQTYKQNLERNNEEAKLMVIWLFMHLTFYGMMEKTLWLYH